MRQGETELVELGSDLLEALLAEVGDVEQLLLGLLDELAYRLNLGATQAVAGPLREIQRLDRQVQIG